ncbi:MAG: hypothetical protein WBO45_07880, partial [Planctomycetota bacterium]
MNSDDECQLLRHTVATLAYRAGKVLRDFPPQFADRRVAPATRTPLELLGHLADLAHWAVGLSRGDPTWHTVPPGTWAEAQQRFFAGLAALDAELAGGAPQSRPPAKIFQGPIADALTHVGQLALLRGMLGAPVRPESYARAEIAAGRVGPD